MDEKDKQDFIKEMGIDRLPPQEQEAIVLRMGNLIFQAVIIRVMQILDDDDKDELDRLLTEKPDDQQALLAFLTQKIPNMDEIIKEESDSFKTESSDFMKSLS